MATPVNQNNKFCGGVWVGYAAITWPFGTLEVSSEELVVAIENLPFSSFKMEWRFTHEEIEKIEIKKYLPIIGYGIKISHKNKSYTWDTIYFWYVSFHFDNLVNTLKEFGWLK